MSKLDSTIGSIEQKIHRLISKIYIANGVALEAFATHDFQTFDDILGHLKSVHSDASVIDKEIIEAFIQCNSDSSDLQLLMAYMKTTNELVRIADGTKKYARRIKEHGEKECELNSIGGVIVQLHKSAINSLKYLKDFYEDTSANEIEEIYRCVMIEESKNDDIFAVLEKDILGRIEQNSACAFEYVRILGTMRRLERVCDRAVNIVNLLMTAKQDEGFSGRIAVS